MSGFFPQDAVHHERTFYFLILVLFQFRTYEHFQFTEDCPAVVVPEHHTRRFFLHMVQVKLLTDFTVVAFSGFFQALQVSVEGFFVCPRSTVNTLQHFVVAIAAPVSPCRFHQFEVMAETHVRYVRTAAHIDIFFMKIETRQVIMGNIFVQDGDFIALAAFNKRFTRFVPANFLLNDVVVFLSKLMHPLLECFDIFLG